MSQKHVAYEFFAPCGCLRAAFVDTGYLTRSQLADRLGEMIVLPSETYVVKRELEDGEVIDIGGKCPHGAVSE